MTTDDDLERTIGEWLLRKDSEPSLLPGAFAADLPEALREPFLRELEALAEIDGLATQAPPRDLPRRFGDFRVLGELGQGAMGAVFEAEQVSTGRRVALKVMHAHVAKDLHSASRFQREARTAAALRHPGIVPVLDFGETDGTAWLAMARVEGRSLQRLLVAATESRDVDHAAARALLGEPRRLARALADAADALEFAHRNGVVHRDVKPANLMCGSDGSVVVLDFGLASARGAEDGTLTRPGDFLGTPVYMAPEQAVGAQNGTPRSDVYALGAVLYECLCGRPPVAPGPLARVIDAMLNRDPVDPRRVRAGVPDELARIALQCLDKDPSRRYATAAALADDLRRFVDGTAVHARGSGLLQRSLRRVRRRPIATAVVAVLVALLVVAVPVVWSTAGAATAAEGRARVLQRDRDLQQVGELLGSAPERLTVFGGASLRFYARVGLGEQIGTGERRSPRAAAALELAADVAARHPGDLDVLRTLARARLDVGDDAAATDAALAAVLAHPDADAGDRMLAAVRARQRGDERTAWQLRAGADPDAPRVAFWLGFWHQEEHDHAAAAAAFSRALASLELDDESRYQALLHRGWCRTCPDVADLAGAANDLTQAAALRPRYATAALLWAALQCLQADAPADLGVPVQKVGEVLAVAEPWVHVLTARVLLALAEPGTVQAGPVSFGAELSPIAVLPLPAPCAAALAATALELLRGIAAAAPFESAFHTITALALLGRHDDALDAARRLAASAPASRLAIVELQRARVLLAAGRAQHALQAIERALAADERLAAAWRFRADVAAHVGDSAAELDALARAVAALTAMPHDSSVFPDAAVALPELQLRRARVLHTHGNTRDAVALLRSGPFGGVLGGETSPRVRLQRHALLARLDGARLAGVERPPAGSPLRWLFDAAAPFPDREPAGADVRAALHRGWLPARGLQQLARTDDVVVAPAMYRRGLAAPDDVATAPLSVLIVNAPVLLARDGAADELLAVADQWLERDAGHGEARVLRALVLQLTDRSEQAARFLVETLDAHPDDLRARYLLAIAAHAAGDRELLRLALRRDGRTLGALDLDGAAAALPLRVATAAATLLDAAR